MTETAIVTEDMITALATVATFLVCMVGSLAAMAWPIIAKLTTISEVLMSHTTKLESMNQAWSKCNAEGTASRQEVRSKLEAHSKTLDNHEYRLTALEGDE